MYLKFRLMEMGGKDTIGFHIFSGEMQNIHFRDMNISLNAEKLFVCADCTFSGNKLFYLELSQFVL